MKRKYVFLATLLIVATFLSFQVNAQNVDSTTLVNDAIKLEKQSSKQEHQKDIIKVGKYAGVDLSKRVTDHFIIGLGVAGLGGTNDTTATHGLSRQFNLAFMTDKPFKSNPHFSLGYGVGISSTNLFFKNRYWDIKSNEQVLPISDKSSSSTDRYKKYKLVVTYLEIPVELRWAKNIENPSKGFKAAIGLKPGFRLSSYTKGKNAIDASGNSIYGSGYVMKERDGKYFRSLMLTGSARAGIGAFSLFCNYSILGMLNGSAGHGTLRPFAIGVAISGL